MDIDIELRLRSGTESQVGTVRDGTVAGFKVTLNKKGDELIIRTAQSERPETSLDMAVREFLDALQSVGIGRKGEERALRIGVFYDLEETVVFPVTLSTQTLAMLVDWDLDLNISGYPCAPEEDENEARKNT
jgi:hypothetical protein